jgi:hypothetical protein
MNKQQLRKKQVVFRYLLALLYLQTLTVFILGILFLHAIISDDPTQQIGMYYYLVAAGMILTVALATMSVLLHKRTQAYSATITAGFIVSLIPSVVIPLALLTRNFFFFLLIGLSLLNCIPAVIIFGAATLWMYSQIKQVQKQPKKRMKN